MRHRLPDHKVKECGAVTAGTKPFVEVSTPQGSAYRPARFITVWQPAF